MHAKPRVTRRRPVLAMIELLLSVALTGMFAAGLLADVPSDYKGKPWKGKMQAIPGKITAVFYDEGGEGVAYHDADPENHGSGGLNKGTDDKDNFRKDEGVDVSYTKESHDKWTDGKVMPKDQYYVGWTEEGEWLNYTVDVKTAGTYQINLLASSNNKEAEISLSINGEKKASLALENTGNVHTWKLSEKIAEIKLDKGPQLLTLKFVKQKKGTINVQYLEFVPKP
jgi:hypothetical protein